MSRRNSSTGSDCGAVESYSCSVSFMGVGSQSLARRRKVGRRLRSDQAVFLQDRDEPRVLGCGVHQILRDGVDLLLGLIGLLQLRELRVQLDVQRYVTSR